MIDEKLACLFENLSLENNNGHDINSQVQLQNLKQLAEQLAHFEKNGPITQEHVAFLIDKIHKTTSKDASRKLLLKCLHQIVRTHEEKFNKFIENSLIELLNDPTTNLGQKLFVFNIYLENLDNFGIQVIKCLEEECLNFILSEAKFLCSEFKRVNTPIALMSSSQNLVWLFKAFILYYQKCLSHSKNSILSLIHRQVDGLLDQKETYNTELCYSVSMVHVLIKSSYFDESFEFIFNSICHLNDDLKTLCIYQALLTMIKSHKIIEEKCFGSFEKLLLNCLDKSSKNLVAISKVTNNWTIRLNEMLAIDNDTLLTYFRVHLEVIEKLFDFIWSCFDSTLDIIRNLANQSYKNLLQSLKKLIPSIDMSNLLSFELHKCMSLSWQNYAKHHGLTLLLENGISVDNLLKINPKIAAEMLDAINERSSACSLGDLYTKLTLLHSESSDFDKWKSIWWKPIVNAIEIKYDKPTKQQYLYEYLLPRILKQFPDGLSYCQSYSHNFSTLIACAKLLRSLNISTQTLNEEILDKTIISNDEQIRLDTFTLVCDNPKTTELISKIEFNLIRKFLNENIDSLSTSYRQCILASVKKLFIRIDESWNSAQRRQHAILDEIKELYSIFLTWLFKFSFEFIHLDGNFGKRNLCLQILIIFFEIFTQKHTLFECESNMGHREIFTLIQVLWDTYVVNKDVAFRLLVSLSDGIFMKNGFNLVKQYLSVSLYLLNSRKPCDSLTSVYLIKLLNAKSNLNDFNLNNTNGVKSLSVFLTKSIVNEFKRHCSLAETNLLLAALHSPIYGPLSAIRNLVEKSKVEIIESSSEAWKDLLEDVIQHCLRISEIVSSIVSSNSPEGIFPMELKALQPEVIETEKLITPQMLLVCCWRTMKEISLFFGLIVSQLPLEHEQERFLISLENVKLIGNYFVKHLLSTRHRGAFELAYTGFCQMCEHFWRCKQSVYFEMPLKWLDYVITLIQSEESKDKICSTRRGGGLPFFVQAIVSTEPSENGYKTLDKTMRLLLEFCVERPTTERENFTQVLSMYVVSALFKDTRIGEEVTKYAEDALMAAIQGFDSSFWNIRNSSTILFSSLMTRIFGVNRSRDEISKKNSIPGKLFFAKYPKLFKFFMHLIRDASTCINMSFNSNLYLVLLVLCRLYTLPDDKSDPDGLLHSYVPLLIKCAHSPIAKIRVFNAKALSTIVCIERFPHLFDLILENLPNQNENFTHGLLEIINCLINKYHQTIDLDHILAKLDEYNGASKICLVNYSTLMNILIKIHNYSMESKTVNKIIELMDRILFYVSGLYLTKDLLKTPGAFECLNFMGQSLSLQIDYNNEKYEEIIFNLLKANENYRIDILDGISIHLKRTKSSSKFFSSILSKILYDFLMNSTNSDLLVKCCEVLTVNQLNGLTKEELMSIWNLILSKFSHQTELKSKVTLINLLTILFSHVSLASLDNLIQVFETYVTQNDDLTPIAHFLKINYSLLDPLESNSNKMSIRLWSILMELLLEMDKNKVALEIVASLSHKNEIFDTLTMIKIALETFVHKFHKTSPLECVQFLLAQFMHTSECDMSCLDEDEEIEVVFDRVKNSIHMIIYQYCQELIQTLKLVYSSSNDEIKNLYDLTYRQIHDRLLHNLQFTFDSLVNDEKTNFNEIKYSFIACNLMFLKEFSQIVNEDSRKLYDDLKSLHLNKHSSYLNCYIQKFI